MTKTTNIMAAVVLSSALTALAGEGRTVVTTPEIKTSSQSLMDSINSKGYGTFSGHVQLLGIYRDYENSHGHETNLGVKLSYISPTLEGFTLGTSYNYAGILFDGGNTRLPLNGAIHLLNEAWISYNAEAIGFEKTTLTAGRQIINNEVFRENNFRQKARGVEAIQLISKETETFTFNIGHAIRMSNWIQRDDNWDYNNFGDVFGVNYDTDGITWGQLSYTGIQGLNVTIYDAYAWDISNLIGARIQYDISDESSLIGYYRHEGDVGKAQTRNTDTWGLSLQQKIGNVTLEPGYFSVHGSNMLFNESTTGINHALGSSMMIYAGQYFGGSDTAYIKATTKINNTILYALYNYTWQDKASFSGQELNFVVKQIISDDVSVGFKAGIAHRDQTDGTQDLTHTDGRVFMKYTF